MEHLFLDLDNFTVATKVADAYNVNELKDDIVSEK